MKDAESEAIWQELDKLTKQQREASSADLEARKKGWPLTARAAAALVEDHGDHLIYVGEEWYYWGNFEAQEEKESLRGASGWLPLPQDILRSLVAEYVAGLQDDEEEGASATAVGHVVGRLALVLVPEGRKQRNPRASETEAWDRKTGKTLAGLPWRDQVVAVSPQGEIDAETPMTPQVIATAGNLPLDWQVSPKRHPAIKALLKDWFPDTAEREWFQAVVVGRTLAAGKTFHALPLLIGAGGAGKSTLLDLITRLVGAGRTEHLGGGLSALASRFATWQLRKAQLLIVPELPELHRPTNDEWMGLTKLKELSGGDGIRGEAKGGGMVDVNDLTVIMASNHPPRFLSGSEDAGAWGRRMQIFDLAAIPASKRKENVLASIPSREYSSFGRHCLELFAALRRGEMVEPAIMESRRTRLLEVALRPGDRWLASQVTRCGVDETSCHLEGHLAFESWARWAKEEEDLPVEEVLKAWKYLNRQLGQLAAPVPAGTRRRRVRFTSSIDGAPSQWPVWDDIRLIDTGETAIF